MRSVDRACGIIAAPQHGAISRAQLLRLGYTPRSIDVRLAAGRWWEAMPGVYVLHGSPESFERSLAVACLWVQPGAASHRAAAALHGLRGVDKPRVEIVTTRRRKPPNGVIVHYAASLPDQVVTRMCGLPVTSVPKTLFDLGSVLPETDVESALDDALQAGKTSPAQLREFLESHGGRGCRGAGVLRRLLEARGPKEVPAHSVLETKVARLLRTAPIPRPVQQHDVWDEGRFVARVDFAWPGIKLVVECDSRRWHSGTADWERDLARRNALERAGWRVLHFTWYDVTRRPQYVIDTISSFFSSLTTSSVVILEKNATARA